MKFPRRRRLLRNPFDATAYAAVFFLLVIFVSLSSRLYTPGVKIHLPAGADLPGTDKPTVTVAMDAAGRYYFQNQLIDTAALKNSLQQATQQASEPLTLVILTDEAVRYKNLQELQMLARTAGINDSLIATTPQTGATSP
ncbi:MAG: biopolymer transporter ExbD [Verrucomicrobiae bacterium]|nr:biopolymer transporter ExbD [Verrucomicrobiae bacterium]